MHRELFLQPDSSVLDSNGKVIFFSIEKFISDIVEGECCFICGAKSDDKEFNNEHVLPEWIIKKYILQKGRIVIPNLATVDYSRYKIPCCKDCNSLLGRCIEKPISQIISRGYEYTVNHIKEKGPWHLFIWLCLIFLKTYLKDKHFRIVSDERGPDYKLSEIHEWASMHHIHCLARAFYTEVEIEADVLGSFLVLPAYQHKRIEPFDFRDVYHGKGIMIRLGDVCVISILNDSCASMSFFSDVIKKISHPLAPLQMRELFARLVDVNMNLKQRPVFLSSINESEYKIVAQLPKSYELSENREVEFGDLFYHCCKDLLSRLSNKDKEEIIQKVKQGKYTFLFNQQNEFIENAIYFNEENNRSS